MNPRSLLHAKGEKEMARRNVTGKGAKMFGKTTVKGVTECPDCGTKFPIYRSSKKLVKKPKKYYAEGHVKDLYCFRCKKVTKHRELSKHESKYNY